MTYYEVTQSGYTSTVHSEKEAVRLAEEGAEVVAITPMVFKDGRLQTPEEAGTASGTGTTAGSSGDPLATGRIET